MNTGSSWVGGTAPGSSDTAKFDSTLAGGNSSATIGSAVSWGGIQVTDTGVSFDIVANGTRAITIGSGGIDMSSTSNGSNNFTIDARLVLGASETFNVASGRTLSISSTGLINNGGNDLTLAGAGTTTLAGVISGAGNVIVAANGGTVTLGAANTYTGDTTVRAGTLLADGTSNSGSNGRLGKSTNAVNIGDSGTLSGDDLALLVSALTGGAKIGRDINVNNYGNSTTLGGLNTSGTNTFSGTIALSKDVTFSAESGGTVTITGNITGTGNITKTGAGTVGLAGTNTYAGSLFLNAGTIVLGANDVLADTGNVTVNNGATLSMAGKSDTVANVTLANGTISSSTGSLTAAAIEAQSGTLSARLSGVFDVVKTTNGTVTLNANNSGLTGNIVVRNGTLNVMGNNNVLGAGSVTVGDSQTLAGDDLALLIADTGRNVSTNITVANYGNTATLGGATTSSTSTFSGTISLNRDTILTEAAGGTISVTGNIVGAVGLTKTGDGTVQLRGTNDANMTGVTVSAGTLAVFGGNAIGDNAAVTVGANGTLSVSASETIGSLSGSGAVSLANNQILTTGNANQNATFSGTISGANSTGLTKTGTGTLTLSGANTYTGTTTVNSGTVLVDLSANPVGVLASTSKLTLNGATFTVQGKSGAASSQTIGTFATGTNTSSHLTVNGAASTSTDLTLSNTWNIGAGSVLNIDLSAAHSFLTSSPTQINAMINAAVTVTDGTTTGFGTVSGGNIIRLTPTNLLTSAATTSTADYYYNTAGSTTLAGTETINSLTFNGTSAGGLDLNGGTLSITTNGVLNTNSQDVVISNGKINANNKDMVVHQMGTGTLTIDAQLTGGNGGSLTKDGDGTLALTYLNTFGGDTVVHAGTLQLGNGTSDGAVAGDIINYSHVIFDNAGDTTYSGAISGFGDVEKIGTGAQTLAGNNIFTGLTTVSQGNLVLAAIGGNQALGSTSAVIINSGGTLILSTDNQVNASANVTLSGGTLNVAANQGAAGAPGIGTLTLTANSSLDLGGGNGIIAFADSSAVSWTGDTVLSINNYAGSSTGGGIDQIIFGTSSSGLTAGQVAQIKFVNPWGNGGTWNALMLSNGEVIVALPEPGTYAAGAALAALLVLWEIRRRKSIPAAK